MATKTSNYGLTKPSETDFYDIKISNDNADIIDAKLKENMSTLDAHAGNKGNPHGVTKAQVGLGNADNTSDANKSVLSATKLTAARTINGVAFDGSQNITITDGTKEPTIKGSTASTYWNGLKSFVDFAVSVRAAVLTGLSTSTNAVITATDTVLSALGKLQSQISNHIADTGSHVTKGAWIPSPNYVYGTPTVAVGSYTLCNSMITLSFYVEYTTTRSTLAATEVTIGGLPYAAAAEAAGGGAMDIPALPSGYSPNGFRISLGDNKIRPRWISSSGSSGVTTTGQGQRFVFSGTISYPIQKGG